MSARPGFSRRDKAFLLERSAVCRTGLRRDLDVLRDSLRWPRVAAAAVASPPLRRIALGLAVSLVGSGRIAKLVAMAGRVFLFTQLARGLLKLAQARRAMRANARTVEPVRVA